MSKSALRKPPWSIGHQRITPFKGSQSCISSATCQSARGRTCPARVLAGLQSYTRHFHAQSARCQCLPEAPPRHQCRYMRPAGQPHDARKGRFYTIFCLFDNMWHRVGRFEAQDESGGCSHERVSGRRWRLARVRNHEIGGPCGDFGWAYCIS